MGRSASMTANTSRTVLQSSAAHNTSSTTFSRSPTRAPRVPDGPPDGAPPGEVASDTSERIPAVYRHIVVLRGVVSTTLRSWYAVEYAGIADQEGPVEVVDIARWQFGITTVYHFLFVPLTIGLTLIVALFETFWLRTRRPEYLRLTKFFGKLFIINFALGLVTGIVQEFQFGMNWSDYSRFVGDIFGAPLAIEGLLAFFLESTFIGLWVFGWDQLHRVLHAACMWIVHLGVLASSWFILAANSWMQHPVGYEFNAATGRAELTDFAAVMFNKVQLVTFPHVVLAAYMTGAAFVIGISAWLYASKRHGSRVDEDGRDAGREDRGMYRKAMRISGVLMLVASLGVIVSGDVQGKIMTDVQPMKMAAAEGLYESSESCAPF